MVLRLGKNFTLHNHLCDLLDGLRRGVIEKEYFLKRGLEKLKEIIKENQENLIENSKFQDFDGKFRECMFYIEKTGFDVTKYQKEYELLFEEIEREKEISMQIERTKHFKRKRNEVWQRECDSIKYTSPFPSDVQRIMEPKYF